MVIGGATFSVMAHRKKPYSRPRRAFRTASSHDGASIPSPPQSVQIVGEEIRLRAASFLGTQRAPDVIADVHVPRTPLNELPVQQAWSSGRIEIEVPDVSVTVQEAP